MSAATPTPSIAVIVPALNEEGNVVDLIAEVRAAAAALPLDADVRTICIVDNGSTDATAARASAAGARVVPEPVRGYGRACLTGAIANADADILVYMDGDRSEVPAEMSLVLAPLLNGDADFVIGSRVIGFAEPGALTAAQVAGNTLASKLIWWLYRVRVTDLGPYRAIRRDTLLSLGMTEMTYGWPTEMIARAAHMGLRVHEVPVTCRRRATGVSKVSGNLKASLKTGWRVFHTIYSVRRTPRTHDGLV